MDTETQAETRQPNRTQHLENPYTEAPSRMYPVYLILCIHPRYGKHVKPYVGCCPSGKDIKERFHQHCLPSSDSYVSRAIHKYGKEWFTVEQIDAGNTPEQAFELEKWWIRILGTTAGGGYNLAEGGEGCAVMGRLGGLSTSEIKAAAARSNGTKGGRPRGAPTVKRSPIKAVPTPYDELGRRGGLATSDAKRAAARRNGAKGGRPRKDKKSRVFKMLNSSADENWGTPQAFFDELDAEFHFTLDAAASASNAKCATFFTKEDDSLSQPWSGRVWCNPPYGAKLTPAFMRKAAAERNNCEVIVMLVPARTSTQWWRDVVWGGEGVHAGVTVRFPPRLKNDKRNHVSGSDRDWPFSSAVVIFRPDKYLQIENSRQ